MLYARRSTVQVVIKVGNKLLVCSECDGQDLSGPGPEDVRAKWG